MLIHDYIDSWALQYLVYNARTWHEFLFGSIFNSCGGNRVDWMDYRQAWYRQSQRLLHEVSCQWPSGNN